ncbi:hypothetical protein [Azospirillum picis]|uniref:Phage baseplate protein n=1 Tax=Azospirillum picis TaxID=488438 RepID=A0ABU0MSR7_9PROT|nr:hypothetical protein [Azospirillum picis]MBP2302805.1 hypothetical protein [Azospirillum picis]MDQ0536533.1 hypothetical protein [Azospirillum picis]
MSIWERGATRRPVDRAALLTAWARPDIPPAAVGDLSLGTVTRALLDLRIATFGPRLSVVVDCESCGEGLELTLDAPALVDPAPQPAGEIRIGDWRVRPPSLADLAAIDGETDTERAVRGLLARCLVAGNGGAVDAATLHEIEAALDAREPDADLSMRVACVACGHENVADLDLGALLWEEIAVSARQLLGDVHRLACAYGWSEAEILDLSPARRAAYLAMVTE